MRQRKNMVRSLINMAGMPSAVVLRHTWGGLRIMSLFANQPTKPLELRSQDFFEERIRQLILKAALRRAARRSRVNSGFSGLRLSRLLFEQISGAPAAPALRGSGNHERTPQMMRLWKSAAQQMAQVDAFKSNSLIPDRQLRLRLLQPRGIGSLIWKANGELLLMGAEGERSRNGCEIPSLSHLLEHALLSDPAYNSLLALASFENHPAHTRGMSETEEIEKDELFRLFTTRTRRRLRGTSGRYGLIRLTKLKEKRRLVGFRVSVDVSEHIAETGVGDICARWPETQAEIKLLFDSRYSMAQIHEDLDFEIQDHRWRFHPIVKFSDDASLGSICLGGTVNVVFEDSAEGHPPGYVLANLLMKIRETLIYGYGEDNIRSVHHAYDRHVETEKAQYDLLPRAEALRIAAAKKIEFVDWRRS